MIPSHHRPEALLGELRRRWGADCGLWVFGYASLIWRPEFEILEQHPALVRGWHRALRLRSVINRGTPERPGLVFALLPGGACRGEVYRLAPDSAAHELERLWQREMPTGVYTPRWLPCRTARGVLPALAFTLARHSHACLPRLADDTLLAILREARGRYGTTLDYLARTAVALRERGIRDREVERMMALAARAGLASELAGGSRPADQTDTVDLQAASATAARACARPSPEAASTSTPGSSTSTPAAG